MLKNPEVEHQLIVFITESEPFKAMLLKVSLFINFWCLKLLNPKLVRN